MDRELSRSTVRKNRLKPVIRIVLILLAATAGFYLLTYFLKPKAGKQDFRMAKVEIGDIEQTISANGLVVPAFELQLNAPVNTEIKEVFLKSGAQVKSGDLILGLDEEYIQLEYGSIKDELELKNNNITKLKLEYEKNLKDLEYEDGIKGLQLSSLESKLKDVTRLKEIGGATQEEVQQSLLELEIARLEKKKLENDLNFRKQTLKSDQRNLELEVLIQEKKLKELDRKLSETSVKAPRSGVITWINQDIGKKVNEGDPIVRLADLQSFRIEASCSDRYSSLVKVGMPVKVRLNQSRIEGRIVSILPAVQNNTLEFLVDLDDPDYKDLRPSMQVEVFIVTDKKENALRVKNGPTFKGAIEQKIFVVKYNEAIAYQVRIGLTNTDFVEIISDGIKPGDQVIISDMSDYEKINVIELKD